MENASKALIMAGTILISVMVVSLGVYIINMFGEYTAKQEQERLNNQIAEFNSQFLKYEGRDDITAQDIVTVANLAQENNLFYELEKDDASENTYYISVHVNISRYSKQHFEDEAEKEKELLENEQYIITTITNPGGITEDVIKTYKCSAVKVSPVTKRVYEITFKENP